MVRFRTRLFRSKLVGQDNDILSYHFKEQCKLQQQINATIPSAQSLHDQPSVRVKANGVIVLNKHHHTSLPLDWVPTIISDPNTDDSDEFYEDDDTIEESDDDRCSENNEMTSMPSLLYNSDPTPPHSCIDTHFIDSFLSAPPRRNRTPLPRKYHSHPILNKTMLPRCASLPLVESHVTPSALCSNSTSDGKVRALIEDMKCLQQDGRSITNQYRILKQQYQGLSLSF